MARFFAIPLLLALVAASPAPPIVQVAAGDWTELPPLDHVSYTHLSSTVMSKIYEIGRRHQCQLPGQSGRRLDLSVSFAAQFTPQGRLTRLLLPQLNCPEAESWLGATLVNSIEQGDFRPDPQNPNDHGWYRGDLSFSYEN